MGLIKCPDCMKMVSDRVKECPNCGCPSEFFQQNENKVDTIQCDSESVETIEFNFGGNKIIYPANSEIYAGLYGDYVTLGLIKYEQLCSAYKSFGSVDFVISSLYELAQEFIDNQITTCLAELYNAGVSMTVAQFKEKYSDLPLDFEIFMYPVKKKFAEICDEKDNMDLQRQVNYENRARWVGGGFGMKGAIKGAVNAGILNAGSSIISGIGNSVVGSIEESIIDRKKIELYSNENVMMETCSGIIDCVNGIFIAYTNELAEVGKLGNKINIDYEAAKTKYDVAMKFEKNDDRLFSTIVECLGLYPSCREFYDAIELKLNTLEEWREFVKFWHLDYLYREEEDAIIKTKAECDSNTGTLKLTKYILSFECSDAKKNINIPINSIKEIDFVEDFYFRIKVKNKFLYYVFNTECNELWVNTVKRVMNGNTEKITADEINKEQLSTKERKDDKEKLESEVKTYIKNNFDLSKKSEAVKYYMEKTGQGKFVASLAVDNVFTEKKSDIRKKEYEVYPGTERLEEGFFENEEIILLLGDGDPEYVILTRKEIIEINLKRKRDNRYDVYKLSKLEESFLGFNVKAKYKDGLIAKTVVIPTFGGASELIERVINLQKGKL